MDLLNDTGQLAYAIAHSWVTLTSGLVGLLIGIFERWRGRKSGVGSLKWATYAAILMVCLLVSICGAWHGLSNKVREFEAEKTKLVADVSSLRSNIDALSNRVRELEAEKTKFAAKVSSPRRNVGPRTTTTVNSTQGTTSPIFAGNGNTMTVTTPVAQDKPALEKLHEKP